MTKTSKQQRLFTGAAALAMWVAICPSPARCGQINGSVQTTDGKPVGLVSVIINIRPSGAGTQRFSTIVSTAANGTFSATGIPGGTFVICPQAPNDLLAPCTWEATWPSVTLTQGQTIAIPPIQLKKGVHLSIRVDDPTGKRASTEGTVPGTSLYVEIGGPNGLAIPTPVIKADGKGHDHDIVIPFDTNLQLRVYSKVLAITDGKGAVVDKNNGVTVPIQVPSGTTPAKLSFTVTGVN